MNGITSLLLLGAFSTVSGQCPAGWQIFGERCLNLSTSVGSWADAMKYCNQRGGQLVNIDTADLQKTLGNMIQSANNQARNITYHTGDDYVYHYLHDLGVDVTVVTSVSFSVQACNDAHIALSATKDLDTADTYEIVIGGWADSESVIRDCKQCEHKDEVHHNSHPLDCSQPNPFWISWTNNYIRVGTGTVVGEQQFMSWNDTDPHPVNYIAIATGWGSQGDWTFYRNTFMPGKFWVGAADLVTEGEWLWLPAQSFVAEYTNWVPGQPDNVGGSQHCMVLDAQSSMQWRDDDCEEYRNFICQKDVGNTIVG